MRITKESARTVSQYAHALSGGYVGVVQTGSDIGNGSRIMDGNSQQVWLGKPRESTAYYLGQVDAFADARGVILADYPDDVAEIRREIDPPATRGEVAYWYALGMADGNSRTMHYCPEIRNAGKPRA